MYIAVREEKNYEYTPSSDLRYGKQFILKFKRVHNILIYIYIYILYQKKY